MLEPLYVSPLVATVPGDRSSVSLGARSEEAHRTDSIALFFFS